MDTHEKDTEVSGGGSAHPPLAGGPPRPSPGLVNSSISRRIDYLTPPKTGELNDFTKEIYEFERDHSLRVHVYVNENGMKIKQASLHTRKKKTNCCPKREIKGFSKASQRTIKNYLFGLNWKILKAESKTAEFSRGIFATLTYPEQHSDIWHDWKSHLEAFRKRLLRKWGKDVSVIWKLENQEARCRKYNCDFIPHFHLVIDLKAISLQAHIYLFRKWLSKAWYEVVGSEDKKHLKAGTNALVIYGEPGNGKLLSYLSKYMSKDFKTETPTGRCWGVWNKFEALSKELYLNVDATILARHIRKWGKHIPHLKRKHRLTALTIYAPNLNTLMRFPTEVERLKDQEKRNE